MAIKALATISVSKEIDIKSYYRYYLSVLSTLGTPTINDRTVRPPTSTIGGTTYTWSTTQPPFSTTGTYTLYFVDCTVFSDDSMKYSDVSVDSDYEASKTAYNESQAAKTQATNAAKVATNFMSFDSTGLMIYDSLDLGTAISPSDVTSNHTFRNVLIDSDSVDIRTGTNVLASFGETTTIGRTDVVDRRYISMSSTPSSSTFGIYRKLESGYSNDFVINSSDNEDSQETYTVSPTIVSSDQYKRMIRLPLAKGVGYEQVRVVCTHPNGSSTYEQTLDLTYSGGHQYSGNFAPSTGASCRYNFNNAAATSFVSIYIMRGSDSSITTSSVFTIDLYYSGGVSTEFLIGGDYSLNSKFAVDASGTLYSNGGVVPAGFAMGDTYWFGQELMWLSNNPYWITSGYITGSKKSIWFSVTLPKPMPFNGKGVRIVTNSLVLAIRVQNTAGAGAYLAANSSYDNENGEDYATDSRVTINAYVQTPTVVSFWLSSSSEYSISTGTLPNNVPLGIRIIDLEITFDEVE